MLPVLPVLPVLLVLPVLAALHACTHAHPTSPHLIPHYPTSPHLTLNQVWNEKIRRLKKRIERAKKDFTSEKISVEVWGEQDRDRVYLNKTLKYRQMLYLLPVLEDRGKMKWKS